jgi:NADPH:quinone reductase
MSSTLTTRAAWYEKNGEARDVMVLGSLPLKAPGAGEVCVRLATSGVNPSDVKSRRAKPLTDPWVVPHSDGAGIIEAVGEGVSSSVWASVFGFGMRSGSVLTAPLPNSLCCLQPKP